MSKWVEKIVNGVVRIDDETIKINQGIRRAVVFGLLPSLAYQISMDKESKKRLKELAKMLRARRNLSIGLGFSHISLPDPAFPAKIALEIDPWQTRKWIALASYSHTEDEIRKNKLNVGMVSLAKRCGMDIIPVIQKYQRNKPKFGYSKELIFNTDKELARRIDAAGNPIGLIISPEGTRAEKNENGVAQLGEAEGGMLHIAQGHIPFVLVPVGISYLEEYDREGSNLRKKVRVCIGEMMVLEDRNNGVTTDMFMRKLSLTISPEMRGRWGQ